jgi:hypothetical protein
MQAPIGPVLKHGQCFWVSNAPGPGG